jgi:hypothetical protein
VRADLEGTDIGVVLIMLCTVADIASDVAPDLWRRYLPMLMNGLRPGADLPVAPITDELFRTAVSTHKQRLIRVGQHAER